MTYLINIEYIILVLIFTKLILKLEIIREKWRYALTIGLTIVCTFLIGRFDDESYVMCSVLVLIALIMCVLFREKKRYLLVYALTIYTATNMMVQMCVVLIASICTMTDIDLSNSLIEAISLTVVIGAVLLLSYLFRFRQGLKEIALRYHILLSIIIFLDAFCESLLGRFIEIELSAERKWIIEMVYIFTVLGVFVQIGLLVAMILSRNEHKEKEALNAKYLEEQVAHYEYLKRREQETRKFRHDMKNHMLVLRNLYDTGKISEFEDYFATISDQITSFGNQISVGNDTADAIINQYALEAEKAGIKLEVEGHFPEKCHIAAVDICTIYSNLLSNAVRAEKEANGKEVKLTIRNLDDEIFVEVRNDYVTEVKRNGDRFISTKEDRANHGLGLQNVYDCVARNHGVIHITTDNRIFDVKLNLKNTEA